VSTGVGRAVRRSPAGRRRASPDSATDAYLGTGRDRTVIRIAAVHNLTIAALHVLCEDHGIDLEQWITHRRLQGARRDPR